MALRLMTTGGVATALAAEPVAYVLSLGDRRERVPYTGPYFTATFATVPADATEVRVDLVDAADRPLIPTLTAAVPPPDPEPAITKRELRERLETALNRKLLTARQLAKDLREGLGA